MFRLYEGNGNQGATSILETTNLYKYTVADHLNNCGAFRWPIFGAAIT